MNESCLPLAEAKRVIHDDELEHTCQKMMAANTFMELCETNPDITFPDMLRCLDYGGAIAEMGARCLYVRTGRDGLGWRHAGANGLPFIVDRKDWEDYLRQYFPPSEK